jgi:IS1 family transposase
MSSLVNAIIASKDALLDAERKDRHAVEDENLLLRQKILELERKIYYFEREIDFKDKNYSDLIKELKRLIPKP